MAADFNQIKRTVGAIGNSLVSVYAAIRGEKPEEKPPVGSKDKSNNNQILGMTITPGLIIFAFIAFMAFGKK